MRNREGTVVSKSIVTVVATTQIEFPSFSLSLDRKTTEYSIPFKQDLPIKLGPKTAVSLKVVAKTVGEFVPTTTLLLLEDSTGKKLTLPMIMNTVVLLSFFDVGSFIGVLQSCPKGCGSSFRLC